METHDRIEPDGYNVDDPLLGNGPLKWKTPLKIGTWNVRSLYRVGYAKNLVEELIKYDMDITVLQEVRWIDFGECTIDKQCIIHSGRLDGRHAQGVGFYLAEKARRSLMSFNPINERLATIRVNCKWFKVTVIGAYAPTEDSEDLDKDLFYEKLQEVLDNTPKHDIIMLAGDFNAKVGRETDAYAPAIGRESLHEHSNDNGTRLASFALANNLIIGGTLFPHKDIHKHTWKSPDSRTINQIDHVLFSRKHRRSLEDVRSLRGADCDTDHFLVRAKIRAKLCTRKSVRVEKRNRYNVEKLKDMTVRENFQLKLTNRFQILDMMNDNADTENVRAKWHTIDETVKEAADDEVGYIQGRRSGHWYDNDCREAVEKRRKVRAKILQTPGDRGLEEESRQENRNVNRILRRKKRQKLNDELDIIDENRKQGRIRQHYQGVRKLKQGYQARTRMIKDKDGEILTGDDDVLKRWEQYFEELLNRPDPANPINEEIYYGPELELEPPTREETIKAIKSFKNNKSPGKDNIPAELWKYGGEVIQERLHDLMVTIWNEEITPDQWDEGIFIPLHKKGDRLICSNY